MTQLYEHQKNIIDENKKKVGLFLGTGSGKTRTSLMLSRGSILVICPKTQKEDKNWEREYNKLNCDGILAKIYPHMFDTRVVVISKETFRRDWESLPRFDTVIVDEAHTCLGVTPNTRQRNRQIIPRASQLFESLDTFVRKTDPERLYLCTATIIRSPMTVWAAGKILGYKWNFFKFRDTFYTKLPIPGREIYVPKSDSKSKDYLARIVRGIGYVGQLSDYFDVPEQTYKDFYVDMTKEQKERIKFISLEYPDVIVQIGKRHQIENGILNGDEFKESEVFPNEKLDLIEDYMIEFPRMIVFVKYTEQITAIKERAAKLKKKMFILTGATTSRGELIAQANKCDNYVFIAQAQVSAGWELPDCPVMVFASRTYSYVDYAQAQGRILRANKLKKNLYINLITRGGVDEAVHKSLVNKQDFSDRIFINDSGI